jgi:3-dehydroquinate synthetase
LNVGHAVGHVLETLSHYKLRHGEAVLLGILAEGYVATQIMDFPRSELDRLVVLYKRMNRRYDFHAISKSAILKKLLGSGSTRFVLPRASGDVVVVRSVPEQLLLDGLRFLASL